MSTNRAWKFMGKIPNSQFRQIKQGGKESEIQCTIMLSAIKKAKLGEGKVWSWGGDGEVLFLDWVSKEDLSEVVGSELMMRKQSWARAQAGGGAVCQAGRRAGANALMRKQTWEKSVCGSRGWSQGTRANGILLAGQGTQKLFSLQWAVIGGIQAREWKDWIKYSGVQSQAPNLCISQNMES